MKTLNEILQLYYKDALTDKDIQCYKENYMSDAEKKIGKPFFQMNDEENAEYKVITFNESSGTLDDYDCPICKNKGVIMKFENGKDEIYGCECLETRRTIKNMKESGLYGLLELNTFDNYKCEHDWQTKTKNRALEFINSNNNWFCMLGSSGCGKSHICTAMSGEFLKRGMGLKYMMWVDECARLKQCITNGEEYATRMSELKNTQVLYIDDFWKCDNNARPSSADIRLAVEILNYRYNKARMDKSRRWITIISSERPITEIFEIDESIGGRIAEMTNKKYLIMLEGADKNYRLKNIEVNK